jgi:hypothetical protein
MFGSMDSILSLYLWIQKTGKMSHPEKIKLNKFTFVFLSTTALPPGGSLPFYLQQFAGGWRE